MAAAAGAGGGVVIGQMIPISQVRQHRDNDDFCWEDSNGKYLGTFRMYFRSKGVTEPSPDYFIIQPATYIFERGEIESRAANEILENMRRRIQNVYRFDNEPQIRRVECRLPTFSELRQNGLEDKEAREILGLHMTPIQRRAPLLGMYEREGKYRHYLSNSTKKNVNKPDVSSPEKNIRIPFQCDWVKRDDKWLLKCPECGRVERSESSGQIKHKDGCPYQSKLMWKPVPREPKPTNGGRRKTRRRSTRHRTH
jgi:hypothetical protein